MSLVGKLLVWVIQTSGPTRWIWRLHPLLDELGHCDFCMGCWVYFGLALVLEVNLIDVITIPVLGEFFTGIIVSFVMHLASLGWVSKWGVEVLE